jgi:YebC/PmpR family DNA-binding regulatory protein
MAGHSKWANRKHRKERQDAKKGKIFSKMARELMIAARQGGPDPETNARLRLAIERAKSFGVPAENIERAIQRGAGGGEADRYEELLYEGYGPGGVALMLAIQTDNRNRTASEIRHMFARHGGNLGEAGCVAWMFERKGLLVVDREEAGMGEDELLALAVEAGAEDFRAEGDTYEIVTAPEALEEVRAALARAGVRRFASAGLTWLPKVQVPVAGREAEQLMRLLDQLEDHDDVQEIYGNYDLAEEALLAYGG